MLQILLFLSILIGAALPAFSAEFQPNEIQIQVKGTAVVPPCHINNDMDVDVNFGLSGSGVIRNGRKFVETWVPVQCDDKNAAWSVKIWGLSISSDVDIIATDITGLGISLSESTKKIPLNRFFKPSTDGGFMLKSQLVITDVFVEGHEGDFNAVVTITAQYD